jgi:hypothetical protein
MMAIRRFGFVAIAVLCFATWAAAGTTATATLTGEGSFDYDGVSIGPYYGTINGGPNTQMICDDFVDESAVNKPWKVDITSFSNLASDLGSTLWGSYYLSKNVASATIIDWYEQAAWLTQGLLTQSPKSNKQAYYSYAVWAVFDPSGVLQWLEYHNQNGRGPDNAACNAVFGSNCGSVSLKNLTSGLLWMAEQDYKTGNYSNFLIITALGSNGKACSVGNCPSQEFIEPMTVAEGGTAAMYLLLAAACCFGGMFFRSRRQSLGGVA